MKTDEKRAKHVHQYEVIRGMGDYCRACGHVDVTCAATAFAQREVYWEDIGGGCAGYRCHACGGTWDSGRWKDARSGAW